MAQATEEALLLTEYAARMSVKNRFLTKILTDRQPWLLELSRADAREALEQLADESERDAESLTEFIATFGDRPAGAQNPQGYGVKDLANMRHRREVSHEVARRLREQLEDETFVTELVHKARQDAWREVADNIEHNLDIEFLPVDADYQQHRGERMRALVEQDLVALAAQRTRTPQPPGGAPYT